jgi:hypothetical protein
MVSVVAVLLLILGAPFNDSVTNLDPFFLGGAACLLSVLVMVPFLFVDFEAIPMPLRRSTFLPRRSAPF